MGEIETFMLNLKFTKSFCKTRVTFLDLNVSFENGSITTDLCTESIG